MEDYCIYLRKSRADIEAEAHGEGETLARHERTCLELAQKQGLSVCEIYREVVSGENISARPQVQKLISEVEQGRYAGVIVMEVERLARGDTIDQGIISRAFSLSHTKIITPLKTYDPDNEYDEEYFEFGLFMSRREYKIINRRIQRGRLASVRDGRYIGSTAPYGYTRVKIKNDKGYTLAPDESEAPIIQRIYALYSGGTGMLSIACLLDSEGTKPRSCACWSRSTISDILRNPVYIGKIRWGYRPDVKKSLDGNIVKRRVKSTDCILVDGLHEPLVTEKLFNDVQEKLTKCRQPRVRNDFTLKNPLTGIIYCAKCGATMTRLGAGARQPRPVLSCSNRYCNNVSAPIDLIEKLVISGLTEWLHSYKVEIKPFNPDTNNLQIQKSINEVRRELASLDKQIMTTFNLLEQGIYDTEIFKMRSKLLSEQKNELTSKLTQLQTDISNQQQRKDALMAVIPRAENIISTYSSLDNAEDKNALLRSVLDRIEYLKDKPSSRGKHDSINFTLTLTPKLK